ncbi:MFS transporter [Burkholderia sp. L27(2015)]|uniref:MFS transporter n=1 Tax=Burkholderia sp. L27(2015) TaxID=1641858 RepID=UPI00131B4E5C|nr:MFS transporter [Burkholderia sp. L27(2015)]
MRLSARPHTPHTEHPPRDARVLQDPSAVAHLGSVLLFSLGSSIITPFFAIYVAKTLGYGLTFSALLISVKVIGQRALSLAGGMLADSYGAKSMAIAGVVIRTASFTLLLLAPSRHTLLASALLNGLGAAIYHPALRKLLYTRYRALPTLLARVIGLRNAFLNLGAALGPLLGLILVAHHFVIACQIIVFVYVANAALLALFREEAPHQPAQRAAFQWSDLRSLPFLHVLVLQFGFFAAYSHFEFLIPVFFQGQLGNEYVALAFIVNTGVVLLVQGFLTAVVHRVPSWLGFGSFLAFFSACAVATVEGPAFFQQRAYASVLLVIVAMVFFTLGEVVLSNRVDHLTTRHVNSRSAGTAFGMVALVGALSLSLMNWLNALLLNHGALLAVWLCSAAVAALFLTYEMRRKKHET